MLDQSWKCGFCGESKGYSSFVLSTPASVHKDINKQIIQRGAWRKCRRCAKPPAPPKIAVVGSFELWRDEPQNYPKVFCTHEKCQKEWPRRCFGEIIADVNNATCALHDTGFRSSNERYLCNVCKRERRPNHFDRRTFWDQLQGDMPLVLCCLDCDPDFLKKHGATKVQCRRCQVYLLPTDFLITMQKRITEGNRDVICRNCQCPPCKICGERDEWPAMGNITREKYHCMKCKANRMLFCGGCGWTARDNFTQKVQDHATKYSRCKNRYKCITCAPKKLLTFTCSQCGQEKVRNDMAKTNDNHLLEVCLKCVYPNCAVCNTVAKVMRKDFTEPQWYRDLFE